MKHHTPNYLRQVTRTTVREKSTRPRSVSIPVVDPWRRVGHSIVGHWVDICSTDDLHGNVSDTLALWFSKDRALVFTVTTPALSSALEEASAKYPDCNRWFEVTRIENEGRRPPRRAIKVAPSYANDDENGEPEASPRLRLVLNPERP